MSHLVSTDQPKTGLQNARTAICLRSQLKEYARRPRIRSYLVRKPSTQLKDAPIDALNDVFNDKLNNVYNDVPISTPTKACGKSDAPSDAPSGTDSPSPSPTPELDLPIAL
uniref:Uncharacterized protein n=1 Tax=Tanacetum cinerariifolium TaxID=118510 RepID=A0A6L2NA24_TANCI|nr:hypothetical protein [Tanacetum cinerariifolium]